MDQNIDYGQDAPGLMRGFLGGGVAAIGGAAFAVWAGWVWAALPLALVGLYLLGMAALMITESRTAKVRDRDAILGRLAWRGDERVLDVGCGRGLMLIGAALRVPQGHATGVDLWRAEDQAHNSAAATLANAALGGVADRVTVQTADMRTLPFADASFDLVLSAWAVHNVPDTAGRHQALAQMWRVLKPGGTLAITDIEGRADYPKALTALGAPAVRVVILHPVKDKITTALSFGSFAPFTVLAVKA